MVSLCYAFHHHIGIFVLLVLFSAWIARVQPGPSWWDELSTRLVASTRNILKKMFYVIPFIAVANGLVWTIADVVTDIRYPYAAPRATAKFIKQHQLDRVPIFASWTLVQRGKNEFFQEIFHVNFEFSKYISKVLHFLDLTKLKIIHPNHPHQFLSRWGLVYTP